MTDSRAVGAVGQQAVRPRSIGVMLTGVPERRGAGLDAAGHAPRPRAAGGGVMVAEHAYRDDPAERSIKEHANDNISTGGNVPTCADHHLDP